MFTVLLNSVLRWKINGKNVSGYSEQKTLQSEMLCPQHPIGYQKVKFWILVFITCVVFILASSGCALHHYDESTGTEHIWGFGHMKIKVPQYNEGLQAVVRGTDVLGLSLGIGEQQNYITAGWHRTQRLDVVAESTAIRYEWPDSDFAKVRIGSKFPFRPGLEIPDSNEQSKSEF